MRLWKGLESVDLNCIRYKLAGQKKEEEEAPNGQSRKCPQPY